MSAYVFRPLPTHLPHPASAPLSPRVPLVHVSPFQSTLPVASTSSNPGGSPEVGAIVTTLSSEPDPQVSSIHPKRLTQAILSGALRRIGLSGSGSKSILADRLGHAGVSDSTRIMSLARMWKQHKTVDPEVHANATRAGAERVRAPNWAKHETARICHVIFDAHHLTIVARMYQRIETSGLPGWSELDDGRHDPFAYEYLELLNDDSFNPDIPEAVHGVTEDLLLQFVLTLHPHKRNGKILKQRWSMLRSSYIVACEKYNKSGQEDPDTFPDYTNGDDSLSYMHCVFYNHPSLDAVVRAISPNAQIEASKSSIRLV